MLFCPAFRSHAPLSAVEKSILVYSLSGNRAGQIRLDDINTRTLYATLISCFRGVTYMRSLFGPGLRISLRWAISPFVFRAGHPALPGGGHEPYPCSSSRFRTLDIPSGILQGSPQTPVFACLRLGNYLSRVSSISSRTGRHAAALHRTIARSAYP